MYVSIYTEIKVCKRGEHILKRWLNFMHIILVLKIRCLSVLLKVYLYFFN